MKNKLTVALVGAVSLWSAGSLMAQGGPPATPIGGGSSLLLAAGAIYAWKKMKAK